MAQCPPHHHSYPTGFGRHYLFYTMLVLLDWVDQILPGYDVPSLDKEKLIEEIRAFKIHSIDITMRGSSGSLEIIYNNGTGISMPCTLKDF